MREAFIETANYMKLVESLSNLRNLPETAPRMGLAYGNYGLGKSMGLERVSAQLSAVLLRAKQTWSKSSLLAELCNELLLDTKGHSPAMYERVKQTLIIEPRVIIIDEVDALLNAGKMPVLELLRDLHDETQIILFFVGMKEAQAKFRRYRHYYSRIIEFVKFEGICKKDIDSYCSLSSVKIEDDLRDFFAKRYPNLRQLKVLLLRLENWCDMNGLDSIDLARFKSSGVEHGINTQE